jgi:hypothetical protein
MRCGVVYYFWLSCFPTLARHKFLPISDLEDEVGGAIVSDIAALGEAVEGEISHSLEGSLALATAEKIKFKLGVVDQDEVVP